jgi:glucose-1-phosphate thymidylyltransferase
MKGVVLVGGLGTRLAPMTRVTNKHLLPVGRFPMVYYPLHALTEAGIEEIILITGGNSPGSFLELLHDGSEFGLKTLYYAFQQAPRGIADALRLAEAFVDGDDCLVMLGDNIVDGSLRPFVEHFQAQGGGARVLLCEVADPERFGVPEFDAGGRIVRIVEKPSAPPSAYAVVGVYAYDAELWDILPVLQVSDRGQYEITDVNNAYVARGRLGHDIFEHHWSDAGTPESLHRASEIAWASSFLPCPETRTG